VRASPLNQFPVYLELQERHCLIIGSAGRQVQQCQRLCACGARVSIISDILPTGLPPSVSSRVCKLEPAVLDTINLTDIMLVIADTGSVQLDRQLAKLCDQANVLCCCTSSPTDGSFMIPAVVDRSPLLIAVGSGGLAPAVSRTIRTRLEAMFPPAYSDLTRLIDRYRTRIEELFPEKKDRARFWHDLIEKKFSTLAHTVGLENVHAKLEQAVSSPAINKNPNKDGTVALVGAGPGSPDLLTFRALRLIQMADVIVYDRLVSVEILDLRHPNSEIIYAGKAKAEHTLQQPEINQLLVNLAKQGKDVVRLKGGDPFIFGRGGEEIETLAAEEIEFQVVPGITAASGCAAFSGIPLTHRDHAQSCVFITGHLRDGSVNLNWDTLTDPQQTIIVYMGLTGLHTICDRLVSAGRSADTPAALIERGTTRHQRVHTGTLQSLPGLIDQQDVVAPTLLIIGTVVTLRDQLQWLKQS